MPDQVQRQLLCCGFINADTDTTLATCKLFNCTVARVGADDSGTIDIILPQGVAGPTGIPDAGKPFVQFEAASRTLDRAITYTVGGTAAPTIIHTATALASTAAADDSDFTFAVYLVIPQ